jgi:hypothetical protein
MEGEYQVSRPAPVNSKLIGRDNLPLTLIPYDTLRCDPAEFAKEVISVV